jgi:hypothetical protein
MLSLTEAMGKGEVNLISLTGTGVYDSEIGLRRGPLHSTTRGEPGESAQRDGSRAGVSSCPVLHPLESGLPPRTA